MQGKWDPYSTAPLFPSPPCPSHPTKGPSAASCWYLVSALWLWSCSDPPQGCSYREGDRPPMQLELGGLKVRGQRCQPHRQSQLLAATWITWKSPHPSAWAAAFAPFCCSTYHIPVVEGGLSHCFWYETLGCWVQKGVGEQEGKKASLMSGLWKAEQEKQDWRMEISSDLLGHWVHYWHGQTK